MSHISDPFVGAFVEFECHTQNVGEKWQRDWVEGPQMAGEVTVYYVGCVLDIVACCGGGVVY